MILRVENGHVGGAFADGILNFLAHSLVNLVGIVWRFVYKNSFDIDGTSISGELQSVRLEVHENLHESLFVTIDNEVFLSAVRALFHGEIDKISRYLHIFLSRLIMLHRDNFFNGVFDTKVSLILGELVSPDLS